MNLNDTKHRFFLILLSINSFIFADIIKVHNKTPKDIYVASYLKPKNTREPARRFQEKPIFLQAGATVELERPPITWSKRLGNDRVIFFSQNSRLLKPEIKHEKSLSIPSTNIGNLLRGSDFYIGVNEVDELKGYSFFEWKIWETVKQKVSSAVSPVTYGASRLTVPIIKKIRRMYLSKENNPFSDTVAYVRTGKIVSDREKKYVQKRVRKSALAWKKLFGEEIPQKELPVVGLSISGGGFRAMVGSLGFLSALMDTGLIDFASYLSTLSGSTWFVAPWLTSGLSISDFKRSLLNRVSRGLLNPKQYAGDIASLTKYLPLFVTQVLRKYAFSQPLSLIDMYGFLIAQMLLRDLTDKMPERMTLAAQQNRLAKGDVPFPIYTSVIDQTYPYRWFEFNPYEVGAPYLRGFVPSFAIGRSFIDGASVDFAPAPSLSYLMAIWGSAIALNFKDIYYMMLKASLPKAIYKKLAQQIADSASGDIRFTAAPLNNFTYKMKRSPILEQKTIRLMDAGISVNIPVPPLMRRSRKINMFIICDCSAGEIGEELRRAQDWAKKFKYKFPKIDLSDAAVQEKVKQPSSLWYDENDPEVPVVVYITHAANPNYSTDYNPNDLMGMRGALNTFNFVYSSENIEQYSGLVGANTRDATEKIKQGLQLAYKNKQKRLNA